MSKRILHLDDHGVVSKGLEKIVERAHRGAVVVGVKDAFTTLNFLRSERWDLVVLDIGLKGKSGLEVLKEIRQIASKLPVLIFSIHTSVEFVRRAINNGASGYISKESSDEELVEAINTILAGAKYVSPKLKDELIFNPQTSSHSALSEREFEVLLMIGDGKTTREIATALHISQSTVDTYRLRIKTKMGMKRDAELVRHCILAGLVTANRP